MGDSETATEKYTAELVKAGAGEKEGRGEIAFWRVRVIRQAFVAYVALNMTLCAVLFLPWAEPRETISGLLGRWCETESGWKRTLGCRAAWAVDKLYWWETNHCREVFRVEREARRVLYP